MTGKIKRYILNMMIVCLAGYLSADKLSAINPVRLDTVKTKLQIPRPALQSVPNWMKPPSDPIDTLDTVNEYIKVILYGDNTWQYYKTPDYQKVTGVFDECWKEDGTNPYGIELADLPASWSIWLVDSLNQYHCPFQGDVHYRGKFGVRRGRRHLGVDVPLKVGDPVYATFTGKVRISKYWGAFGNLVVIRHDNGIETFYAHLSKRNVEVGDWVNAGDVIGLGGSTGRSTGPHLHFETRYKGFAFDPQWLIDFKTGELRHRLFVLKKKYFNIYSNYEQDFEDEMKNHEEDAAEDAERAAMKYYVIRSGDTLSKIARNNGTTVSELCRLNGMTTKTTLRIGKKIRVR
ncbi:MAG: LysM peptidoglycan-binding domain-containing protein [Bacteroidales bacterium]|nr:LysM peptidoglycan-binding domain-containing protein [Bacteroidales bacterium]MBQ8483992.1 peptidoglycan DD-metalloendopeptidase family protein [Bacteroidales bacterium]